MKDYSAMSDFEVNKQVAHYFYGEFETAEGCVFVDAKGDGANVILISGVYDPCNNPADAWPIIVESGIGVMPFKSDHARAWDLSRGLVGDRICHHANPLRAAMIVYLQMMEGK